MDLRSKIILIYGPTASGKSNFAIKLSKKVNGEIINADSMQVYKELKILSARPSKNEYKRIKHHLFGFHSVKKKFSTGDWLKLAKKKIKDVKKRKKVPILVGGTGLYFKALTDGLAKIPNIPMKLRLQIRKIHKKIGQEKFYKKLIKFDKFSELTDTFRKNGIPTYTELIMGMPGETLESWKAGLEILATDTKVGSIYIYNCGVFPNAPMNETAYKGFHKIKTIRFGEQGAKTAGKPKAGESDRMKKKRASFKARHRRNIAKGKMSAAYWANKVKW